MCLLRCRRGAWHMSLSTACCRGATDGLQMHRARESWGVGEHWEGTPEDQPRWGTPLRAAAPAVNQALPGPVRPYQARSAPRSALQPPPGTVMCPVPGGPSPRPHPSPLPPAPHETAHLSSSRARDRRLPPSSRTQHDHPALGCPSHSSPGASPALFLLNDKPEHRHSSS